MLGQVLEFFLLCLPREDSPFGTDPESHSTLLSLSLVRLVSFCQGDWKGS